MSKKTVNKLMVLFGALIMLAILILFGLIAFISAAYRLTPNNTAIITRFGRVTATQTETGLHFHAPFIEDDTKIYTGEYMYDIPVSDVITADKKSMIADNYVVWRVSDPVKYYQSLGGVKGRAEERIEAAVFNATKNVISSMTQDEIVAARGNTLTNKITDASNSDTAQYGVVILLAEIKALDLPDDNKTAVFERMISERNNIAASYTAQGKAEAQKIRNETDKQVAILKANANKEAEKLKAEGEAEYMRILSEAYNNEDKADFYTYLRSLDALEALKGDDNTLLLDKDSEFTRILYGSAESSQTQPHEEE